MDGMNPRLFALLLCASLIPAVCAHAKTILPDACGDDSIKFEVSAKKNQPPPAPPPEGKAQIVLVEDENMMIGAFMYATVRFGMDGAWIGANYNNSYFVVNVDPGVHHLCASWQSALMFKKSIDVASFTAETGKVYYFAADVKVTPTGGSVHDHSANYDFGLSKLDEDEGKYRIKAWKLATWKTNK